MSVEITGLMNLIISRNNAGDSWKGGADRIYPVDEDNVRLLLETVSGIKTGHLVAETEEGLPFYGLTPEAGTRILLRTRDRAEEIIIGFRQDDRFVYVRKAGSFCICTAPSLILELLDTNKLMDMAVFPGSGNSVQPDFVEIASLSAGPGMNYILVKDRTWIFYGEDIKPDSEKTEQMVRSLMQLNGDKLVPFGGYPFPDNPPLTVTVETSGGKRTVLSVGYSADGEYIPVRRDEEPFLYLILPEAFSGAVKPSTDLSVPQE